MENDTLDVILSRSSIRAYTPQALSMDQTDALVSAALAAPSGMNSQPWHISVVTDRALLDEIDGESMRILGEKDPVALDRMLSRGGKILYDAPEVFFISGTSALDAGILVQNIALAAQSLGLGSVILGLPGLVFAGPRGAEFAKRLAFPEGYPFQIAIAVGYIAAGKAPHERDISKVSFI